jgi:glycosyltransferase involved in cell wall biosynthesis
VLRRSLRSPHIDARQAPLVSVVIATYNRSEVLRHAVRSALWQTYPSLEVLVVGDGCTDDSQQVVAELGDERVRWIGLPENSGNQATPNNEGIRRARGAYVAYLGHDDVWLPDHLARLVPAMNRARAEAGATITEIVGPPGSNIRSLTGHEPNPALRPPSSLAHKRETGLELGGWRPPEEIVAAPDRDFVGRLYRASGRFVSVRALTVVKFSASLRRNSYRTRSDAEQAACVARIQSERSFVLGEVLAVAAARLARRRPRFPEGHPGDPLWGGEWGPGEFVAALRRVKGLDGR